MRFVMTGATGYLGARVAAQLILAQHEVVGLARSERAAASMTARGVEPVLGHLGAPEEWLPRLDLSDGFIHTAFGHGEDFAAGVAEERAAIAAVLAHLSGAGKLVLAATATGVLGDTGATPVDESFSGQPDFPAAIRKAVEHDLVAAAGQGIRSVVIRPAILVHGHGASQFVPHLVRTAMRTGVAGYIGEGENHIATVHVDDLADLVVRAATSAKAGALFNAAGGDITTRTLADAITKGHQGVRLQSLEAVEASTLWGPFPALLLAMNNRVSNDRARVALGWAPYADNPTLTDDLSRGSYAAPHFS